MSRGNDIAKHWFLYLSILSLWLRLHLATYLAEPKYVSCVRLGEILAEVSRDRINRSLLRERYTPKALFEEVSGSLI